MSHIWWVSMARPVAHTQPPQVCGREGESGGCKIVHSSESDPDGEWSRGGFDGTVVVADQLCQQFHELREKGWLFRQRIFRDDSPLRLPFARIIHGGAGKCRASAVQRHQRQHATGDDLVKRQTVLQSRVRFELNVFDTAARFQNPEIDFHRPRCRVIVDWPVREPRPTTPMATRQQRADSWREETRDESRAPVPV